MKAIVNRINISYALSIVIPDADAAGLRTMLDWGKIIPKILRGDVFDMIPGNWAFPFDEQFDDGVINDPIQAQAMMDILLSAMNSPGAIPTSSEIRPPIVEAHDDLFRRIAVDGPSAITRRYAATMQRYCAGIVSQVSNERGPSRTVSISSKEQFLNRRDTAGIEPLFPLIEHALKLKLPHDVLTHDSIRECERIAIDLVLLANDIVSYRKEESDGFGHNLVAAARRQGLGAQAAFDAVGSMLEERYQDWTVAVAGIPEWGGQIDADVKRYVAAVKNIVVANVNWSFDTTRYFGGMTKTVKETLMVDVLEDVGGTK